MLDLEQVLEQSISTEMQSQACVGKIPWNLNMMVCKGVTPTLWDIQPGNWRFLSDALRQSSLSQLPQPETKGTSKAELAARNVWKKVKIIPQSVRVLELES